ncbi:MAG: indoleacetamide hydrolase [Proteobacteria bacterium]|nr:indoleacetamide hydrolase [Pseudomonadota bacterium]
MKHLVTLLSILAIYACTPEVETPATPIPAHPTATELLVMMEAGETSSAKIVAELLRRAGEAETLNAFITIDAEGARARAEELDRLRAQGRILGPLHGLPLVAKDNIHVAGLPNTAGTPGLREFTPDADSAVVAALLDAGALVIGKTNMHELAFGITSDNAAFGAVANPFDTTTFAGGSSGGTASAIAAGLAPAGLGTDTGGSIRIPAALTGTVGFRPSNGRYPSSGVTPISHTRDTIGLIAWNVADLILLDEVIEPQGAAVPSLAAVEIRLGVPRTYYYANLDEQSARIIDDALIRLADAGVTLIEVDPEGIGPLVAQSGFPIALYEAVHDLSDYLDAFGTGVTLAELAAATASPDVHGIFAGITGEGQVSEEAYTAAMKIREDLRRVFRDFFSAHDLDAIVFPTTLLPARPIENSMQTVELNGAQVPTFATYIHNTEPGSIAALPGISLPVGWTAGGLPVGIAIDGPENSDRQLLAVAAILEQIFAISARPAATE